MEATIIEAVKKGDIESVQKLIATPEYVNQQDEHGWTALHWAAGKGDAESVRLLVGHGANPAVTGKDERTPLMVARAASRREVVRILTEAEQARGQWLDPDARQLYCKAYEISDLRRFSGWVENQTTSKEAAPVSLGDTDVVYLHEDFTVTRSMWPDQEVVFSKVTPEWKSFCQTALEFLVPSDLL